MIKNMEKTSKIEGLPYNIGDKVKISTDYKLANERTSTFFGDVFKLCFGKNSEEVNSKTTFLVNRMKIDRDIYYHINVKVKVIYEAMESKWMHLKYFKK